ncbi:MAG: hypothetical protein GWN58_16580, partial [Anaerolineae bacterium]|nr:hypothetical protein [Anaerolineae bacterium]
QQVRWPNNTSVASAAIAASEDIAVEAENHNQGADVATNYTGISYPPHGDNPGWGQAATTLYEPTIKRDFFNATSDLHIMNVGSGATNVTIAYYNDSGTFQGSLACNLAPQAKCVKVANSAWGTLLNARITANQPLAVVNVERDAAGSPTRVATNHASANPTTFLYAPIYKKNWYSQNTSLHIRNTSSSQASVTVTYYDQDSSASYSDGPYLIPPNGVLRRWAPSVTALPVSFAGSAVIDSDKPIVARLYEQGEVRKMSNGTFVQGSQASYVPVACNTCGGWRSYIRVQNVGSAAAEVQVRYYDSGGNAVGNPETLSNLGVYRARNAASLPGGLDGSAVLTADQPIIVRVYLVYPDTSQDLSMTYDAPNR